MGQCPFAQAPAVARGNSTIHFNDFAVINANSRMKISTLGVKVGRRVIIEVQQDQDAVDYGNCRHGRQELRTRRTASFQPA
jgi:hypothetical protein